MYQRVDDAPGSRWLRRRPLARIRGRRCRRRRALPCDRSYFYAVMKTSMLGLPNISCPLMPFPRRIELHTLLPYSSGGGTPATCSHRGDDSRCTRSPPARNAVATALQPHPNSMLFTIQQHCSYRTIGLTSARIPTTCRARMPNRSAQSINHGDMISPAMLQRRLPNALFASLAVWMGGGS